MEHRGTNSRLIMKIFHSNIEILHNFVEFEHGFGLKLDMHTVFAHTFNKTTTKTTKFFMLKSNC